MTDLKDLDALVGKYVSTSRPRTALEQVAYGGFGHEGGAGVLVEVGPLRTVTVEFEGQSETLTGRDITVDWGMSWLVTEDTDLSVFSDETTYMGHVCRTGRWWTR